MHEPKSLSAGSISAEFTSKGALSRLDALGLSMIQYPATEAEDGLAGLWLRLDGDHDAPRVVPLLGAASRATAQVDAGRALVRGADQGFAWTVEFRPSADRPAWFWHLTVTNESGTPASASVVWATDVALTPYAGLRINEFYVAQYLDLAPIETPTGVALAVRQNMPGERQPWALLGSTAPVAGWATDAKQVTRRIAGRPTLDVARPLPSRRLQHEHTWAALETAPVDLAPGASWSASFFGVVQADHPAASGPEDAAVIADVLALPEAAPQPAPAPEANAAAEPVSLFATAATFEPCPLPLGELAGLAGPGVRHLEGTRDDWWAFVTDDGEAVTSAAKEHHVLRPHGHIMRSGTALTPSTEALTTTVYHAGLFASQLTEGHVARGTAISGRRTYLGLQPAHGLRAFVKVDGAWQLLDVASAWGITAQRARWWYAGPDWLLEVASQVTADDELVVTVRTLRGAVPRVLLAAHLGLSGDDGLGTEPLAREAQGDGVRITAPSGRFLTCAWRGDATLGDDAPLFADAASRGLPFVTWLATGDLRLAIAGDLVPDEHRLPTPDAPARRAKPPALRLSDAPDAPDSPLAALDATLPWFAQNALIHYLSPRGLEQFTGGAWGTRDVSQGPVGLLLAVDDQPALRDVLVRIMAGQNDRGDWPQAFDFLPPVSYWQQLTAHGDVIAWPLLALADYLLASGDGTILAEEVAFVAEDGGTAPAASVREHVERALDRIQATTIEPTALPAYGHGDWNDSLQPADPRLAERMASSWTAVLFAHALHGLGGALRAVSGDAGVRALADRCTAHADAVARDVREHFLVDGVLAGYGVFDDDSGRPTRLLVHPQDDATGLTYGVLPWIHAISGDLLAPDEAAQHLALLREHLWGPDGARLFDRPPAYRGGPLEIFKRAEAATFWGREIGLMYTHAHLRYAEALARVGDAEGLLEALLLVCPFGYPDRVPAARPRQSTCYYSSSDGAFADRADAAARYPDLLAGEVPLEGGWRVYSSGPGLFLRLVVHALLGLRRRGDALEVDPVLPGSLDGLVADVTLAGRRRTFVFRLADVDAPRVRTADGEVPATALANPYRTPGCRVRLADLGEGPVHVEVPRRPAAG